MSIILLIIPVIVVMVTIYAYTLAGFSYVKTSNKFKMPKLSQGIKKDENGKYHMLWYDKNSPYESNIIDIHDLEDEDDEIYLPPVNIKSILKKYSNTH
jgi:hypothetical protein